MMKNLKFYPIQTEEYTGYSVSACVEDAEGNVEPVDSKSVAPDFWSVYIVLKDGTKQCIADLPDRESAIDFTNLILSIQ